MSSPAGPRSRRALVAAPLLLFSGMVGATVLLAVLHLAQPGVPKAVAGSAIELGDSYRGETVFGQTCAGCHGDLGKGGGVGPRLAGSPITLELVKARIDSGKGVMPAGLLTGGPEKDVLAYVASIIAAPEPRAGGAPAPARRSRRGS